MRPGTIKYLLVCMYIALESMPCYAQKDPKAVRMIEWNQLTKPFPDDSISHTVKTILLNVNKYALGTWFHTDRQYTPDSTGFLDLKSISKDNEYRYRLPAGMAFGLAISLKTGAYDSTLTGVSTEIAVNRTVQLLSAVAYDHKINNTRKVWGGDWQAAHWAYYSGYAAWLLWDQLPPQVRQHTLNMIISEADRLAGEKVLFYKNKNGAVLFPGDSKIEENNWNAELLYLAAIMMPLHPHYRLWYHQAIAYMIAAVAMKSDLENTTILHGKMVKDWLQGYNVENPGIVINHHIVHPLYNALSSVVNAPIVFALANEPTPEAARFNMDKIYNSLINTSFDSSKYAPPGGTMYIPEESEVYYPQGSDWGKEIYDSFANMDIAAWQYKLDNGEKRGGKYWAGLHLKPITRQQSRFSDGHTYLNKEENSYYGKEAAIATRMASAWMTLWVQHQHPVKYENFIFN